MSKAVKVNDECKAAVMEFLKDHPDPATRAVVTMKDGYVMCITPIKTICGAELMCSANTLMHVRELINDAQRESAQ